MKKLLTLYFVVFFSLLGFSGCGEKSSHLDPNDPITLSFWHVYGSQTESPLNDIIETFNETAGKESGVIVSVTSVTDSDAIDKALAASAGGNPGAASMPDLFTAYPRVAETIGTDRLLDWSQYYTKEELSLYVEDFLQEGYIDDKLLMLPIAKSSELLFLNKTLFDRFTADTGTDVSRLTVFEGLFDACCDYYDWSGGKTMFQINDFYHYFLTGMQSKGGTLIQNGTLNTENAIFREVYTPMAEAAIYGGICVADGYASDRWKTGEVISNIGSTAGILYLRDYVTYVDNTTEDIETLVLEYPVFAGADAAVMQRGTGLFCMKNDDEKKNEAAALFAKWISETESNLDFTTHAGYLPVTTDAFDGLLAETETVENEKYRMVYDAVGMMYQDDYTFCSLPQYDGAGNTQERFEEVMKSVLNAAQKEYAKRTAAGENGNKVMEELLNETLDQVQKDLQ